MISLLLALLALSFLIFIHELGHYFMARREGMKVETFSIGFGRPLLQWKWQGVSWQIGWLLFGGYVRIAGTDAEKDEDIYSVKEGFFGKSPWARIKVAFMGPFINIVFALLVFSLLWINGGREKPYSEFTHKIGWVDPKSLLFEKGVRPGDEISYVNEKPYHGYQDLFFTGLTQSGPVELKGRSFQGTGEPTPFTFSVTPYPISAKGEKNLSTLGILAPASYLLYDRLPGGAANPLPEQSPMKESGIQYGDRILWVDGHTIFSTPQLSYVINDGRALLTIDRNGERYLARVPRVQIHELRLSPLLKDEITDWQYASGLQGTRFNQLFTVPYNLTHDNVVEGPLRFVDSALEKALLSPPYYTSLEAPLEKGDRIIAVDGVEVANASQLIKQVQTRKVSIIVQRLEGPWPKMSWREGDRQFDLMVPQNDLDRLTRSIGNKKEMSRSGHLVLLKAVEPKKHRDIWGDSEEEKQKVLSLEDSEKKAQLLQILEERQQKLEIGVPLRDVKLEYNPIPTDQFLIVFGDIWKTLTALFEGQLNPKWLSGPVGIVSMMQEHTRTGVNDALYWIGMISLNLGILNLLPIPMLDGGTILLSLFEWVTGRRLKPKTIERLILPFAILLISFFIFLTYHDLSRLFGGFWKW
jgi:regulator of sigma E protease